MKSSKKTLSETAVGYTITLDAADLTEVKPLTVAKLSQNLSVPGFRRGKVPTSVAEKNINQDLLQSQLMEDAINKFVIETINGDDIQPLDRPRVEVGEYVPGEKLEFTATVEILPKVTLGDYKSLKATRDKVSVAASDINDVIERMRKSFAEKKEVTRAAKADDEVWIDFEGTDKDGKAVAGASGTDYPLVIGSGTFIPGFEEGLVGHKAGDEFDLELTFPKDYHHKPLAGATITFKTTVKKINEVVLPKVDDEFAAKCGPFTSVDELKSDIKRELTAQRDRTADDKLKDELVEQLVQVSTVPVPDTLVHDQMHAIERDALQNLTYRGMTPEQYMESQGYKDKQEWHDKEFREGAIRRVQVGLALAELTKAEGIDVTTDELEARLQQYKEQSPKVAAQFDTPETRRDVANRVMTEKTVDRLVELNTKKK